MRCGIRIVRDRKVPTIPVGCPNLRLPVSVEDVEDHEYGIVRLEIWERLDLRAMCP